MALMAGHACQAYRLGYLTAQPQFLDVEVLVSYRIVLMVFFICIIFIMFEKI